MVEVLSAYCCARQFAEDVVVEGVTLVVPSLHQPWTKLNSLGVA